LSTVRIWIDATPPASRLRVFGMGLLERALRCVAEAMRSGVAVEEVRVAIGPGEVRPELPEALRASLPLHFDDRPEPPIARLSAWAASGTPVVALHADSVVDPRLVEQLARASGNVVFLGKGERALDPGAVLRLEPGTTLAGAGWIEAALELVDRGAARRAGAADFDSYITMLRRALPPYVFRVPDERARRRIERFLFWSNYKGSTDFMTRWVYPPLVWLLVRPLARWRIHPHWVTGVDIAAAFAAIPFFMQGAWLPGLVLAYLMSVLDSVDGKLARLTFSSSKIGEILDHGLDIVHPPLWYLAWGHALGGGDTGSAAFQAAVWMLAFYVLDRLCAALFKWRHGESIHGFTPLDERARTWISRRNVNLPVFTAAVLLDAAAPGLGATRIAFYAIVAWQAICLGFHLWRLAALWNVRKGALGEAIG